MLREVGATKQGAGWRCHIVCGREPLTSLDPGAVFVRVQHLLQGPLAKGNFVCMHYVDGAGENI